MAKRKKIMLSPTVAKEVLKHLKRAGHNKLGESHVVYPEPGKWDIEMDKPGCTYGLWLVDDPDLVDEDDAPRTQRNECTCGYSKLLNIFEPGEEEAARLAAIEREIWVGRAVENREHNVAQFGTWLIENDPDWAVTDL